MSQRSKLHQAWDIGSFLTLIMMTITGIWYFAHDHARMDFLSDQVMQLNIKVDKIYDILLESKK